MMPTAVPLAPSSARNGPVDERMPSYAMSANRLTMPKAMMKARAERLSKDCIGVQVAPPSASLAKCSLRTSPACGGGKRGVCLAGFPPPFTGKMPAKRAEGGSPKQFTRSRPQAAARGFRHGVHNLCRDGFDLRIGERPVLRLKANGNRKRLLAVGHIPAFV